MGGNVVRKAVDNYILVTLITAAATIAIAAVAVLPSIWPQTFSFLNAAKVDTDPENMLSSNEPVRVFHDRMKKRLSLYDMVVVGVVNTENPKGVFNPESLKKIYELTEYAKGLSGEKNLGVEGGVVEPDVIAPSTVDNMKPIGPNELQFSPLMRVPPKTQAEADAILADAQRIPFFRGTMVPPTLGDGQAVCIYLPITSKNLSHDVYTKLNDKIAQLGGPEQYYITGLPVAEDTFGYEMFIQMAISAPAAMLVIFVLMFVFFRKLVLIVSPMLVAMASVIFTMGSLIIAGFPIHIMSSMIPIFIMPIAVLDSIHIISEFFERYQQTRDRRKTILAVMDELFSPMLYTSLTSAAGFASLALTPIPPVQVFGIFVAAGIMVAWVLTITFIPAYVMFISPKTLENFGARHHATGESGSNTLMARMLRRIGGATYRWAKPILAAGLVVLAVAIYGITRININDNPIKWFTPSHPIRVADRVLNEHFGGTYMAYLAIRYQPEKFDHEKCIAKFAARAELRQKSLEAFLARLPEATKAAADRSDTVDKFFEALKSGLKPDSDTAGDEEIAAWSVISDFIDRQWSEMSDLDNPTKFDKAKTPVDFIAKAKGFVETCKTAVEIAKSGMEKAPETGVKTKAEMLEKCKAAVEHAWGFMQWKEDASPDAAKQAVLTLMSEESQADEVFKRPDVLAHIEELQKVLEDTGIVGKSNSLVEIVATVNRDLHGGNEEYYKIPPNRNAVAQCIQQFQQSHRPQDLDHFVVKGDYQTASIWVQLKSGDNKDMAAVARAVDEYLKGHSSPVPLEHEWFGLTYINVVWQDRMVSGMLQAFAGSFLVVFVLMVILFRSPLWGLLSMIPLTVTIGAIYGAIGLLGRDYDMPVAVLSSLTLGLAVDFAIHFLARGKVIQREYGSWEAAAPAVFGEPARAITRNIIVIAAGFLPLLLAPLVPYKTVGILMATILLVSGVGSLLLLPALVRILQKKLFTEKKAMGPACNCAYCAAVSVATVLTVALSVHQSMHMQFGAMTIGSGAAIVTMMIICGVLSRRSKCKIMQNKDEGGQQ